MLKFLQFTSKGIAFGAIFFLFINLSNAQTKAKENFVFDHPDALKKQIGIRLSDSAQFILFDNRQIGYTELFQKGQSYFYYEKPPFMYVVDWSTKDTVGIENFNVLTLEKNAKYQWVVGEGLNHGYFFRKGEIVLTVETINKKKKCYVKISYNPRDPNMEFLKKLAIYKAHKDLSLNHHQKEIVADESPLE